MSLGVLSRTPASNSSTKTAGVPACAFEGQQKKSRKHEARVKLRHVDKPQSGIIETAEHPGGDTAMETEGRPETADMEWRDGLSGVLL